MSWQTIYEIAGFVGSLFTTVASGIAIWVFVRKRKAISSVFNLLANFSYQLTLSELKEKLERLNDYNVNNADDMEKIVNILHELEGQIRGNDKLKLHFSDQVVTIQKFCDKKGALTEPRKRSLVSELRERIRHLNVHNIDDLVGED